MNLRLLKKWVLAAVYACVAPVATATVLTIEAHGTVTFVNTANGFFSPAIAATNPGDPFLVRYRIDDTATTDTNANPNIGNYHAALLSMSVFINNISILIPNSFNANRFLIVNNDLDFSGNFRDSFGVNTSGCQTAAAGMCLVGSLQFINSSTTAPVAPFTSDAFRALPGDLSQFGVTSMTIGIGPGPTISNPVFDQIGGAITSVTITSPVPQPASVWLMLLGLAALVVKAGRPQRVR